MTGGATRTKAGRLKRILATTVLVVVALLVALVLTEVALRVFRLAPPQGIATMSASEFERLPGIYGPDQAIVDLSIPALPHHVRIDSLGFRGADFARRKPDGGVRVLFTGDSFTYGDFVDDSLTLPAQLQGELAGRCGGIEVINAGLRGSTIIGQEALIARSLTLAPDLVVLMFSENDVTDMADPLWLRLAANRRLKSRWPMSFVYPILRHTALWNLALRVRATARARNQAELQNDTPTANTTPLQRTSHEPHPLLREAYLDRLGSVVEDLEGNGIPLVLALYPSHFTVSADHLSGHLDWLIEWASERNIPTIDLATPLRGTGLPDTVLYLLPYDGHPSPTGYRVAAETIAEGIAPLPVFARCRK